MNVFLIAGLAVLVVSATAFVACVIQLVRLRRWTGHRPIKARAGSWAPLQRRGSSGDKRNRTHSVAAFSCEQKERA